MVKIGTIKNGPTGNHRYFFMCPGCGYAHCFSTNEPVDCKNPTIKKPIAIAGHIALFNCHATITNGQITFSEDCTHQLKGLTTNLPNIV